MKSTLIYLFIFLIVNGCRKTPLDYRYKYVGNYSFTVEEFGYGGSPPHTYIDSTYKIDGKITFSAASKWIAIITPKFTLKLRIYEDGSLEGCGGIGEFISSKEMRYRKEYQWAGGAYFFSLKGRKK